MRQLRDCTEKLRELATGGFPIFGTCAGMIVMARDSPANGKVTPVELMDITVKRNAFGRQVDSFETDLEIPVLGKKPFPAVFHPRAADRTGGQRRRSSGPAG